MRGPKPQRSAAVERFEAETRGQDVVASATYEVDRDGMPLLVDVRVLIARHRMVVSSITCELAWPQDRARAVAIAESIRLVRAADAPT